MLKILTVPNPILTTKSKPVEQIDGEVLNLIPEMIQACRAAQGIGLAAPQIGKLIRLCIINLEHIGIAPFALINPKISRRSWKKIDMEEGCLSIPGIFGVVRRPEKITVKATAPNGKSASFKADGLLARVIQHEIDHLDGVLFTSKLTKKSDGRQPESKNEKY